MPDPEEEYCMCAVAITAERSKQVESNLKANYTWMLEAACAQSSMCDRVLFSVSNFVPCKTQRFIERTPHSFPILCFLCCSTNREQNPLLGITQQTEIRHNGEATGTGRSVIQNRHAAARSVATMEAPGRSRTQTWGSWSNYSKRKFPFPFLTATVMYCGPLPHP